MPISPKELANSSTSNSIHVAHSFSGHREKAMAHFFIEYTFLKHTVESFSCYNMSNRIMLRPLIQIHKNRRQYCVTPYTIY